MSPQLKMDCLWVHYKHSSATLQSASPDPKQKRNALEREGGSRGGWKRGNLLSYSGRRRREREKREIFFLYSCKFELFSFQEKRYYKCSLERGKKIEPGPFSLFFSLLLFLTSRRCARKCRKGQLEKIKNSMPPSSTFPCGPLWQLAV